MRKHVLKEQRIDSFEEWLQYACGATYTLEEMLNDLDADQIMEEVRLYAIEVAKEALRLASENAEFIAEHQFYEETIKDRVDNVGSYLVFIDKQSILSETNIPKLY